MKIWHIDLKGRRVTHGPSGLVIQFTHALNGSGAMQADLLNPEALPDTLGRQAFSLLLELPKNAWQVYAEAAEKALQQADEAERCQTPDGDEIPPPPACRCRT